MLSFYNHLAKINIVLLSLALYFALISYLPTFDLRKVLERKSVALILGYFALAISALLLIFWYLLVQELLIVTSKQRCIVEIMKGMPFISVFILALKIFSFPVIAYVFSYRHLDVELKGMPFLNVRVNTVIFGSVYFIAEKLADGFFLKNITLFTSSENYDIYKIHSGVALVSVGNAFFVSSWVYILSALAVCAMLLLLIRWSQEDELQANLGRVKKLKIAAAVVSLIYIAALISAFNDELCPRILDLANHTCIFCAMQYSFDIPLTVLLNLAGFGMLLSLAFLPSQSAGVDIKIPQRNRYIFSDKSLGIFKAALVFCVCGLLLFLARALISVFN